MPIAMPQRLDELFRIILAMAQETARSGGGYIAYLSTAPGGMNGNDAAIDEYIPRIGYVYPVNSTGWMGAGMDLSDLSGAGPEPGPVVTMQILVRQGVEYGQKYGKERAHAEISNRSGLSPT